MDVDYWYNKWKRNSSSTACAIRVTNKCNQRCAHCLYRSGPECVGQMSVEMCKEINSWIPHRILPNIMGGEFSVLDNYPEILIELARNRDHVRLVTNGFWSGTHDGITKFLNTRKQILKVCSRVSIIISTDEWHDSSNYLKALDAIQTLNFGHDFGPGTLRTEHIAPVGRAWDNNITNNDNIHRLYCTCESMSNMIITEDGMIGRCPFGYFPWKHFSETTWHDTQEYVWGWRSEKLAEGMNCHSCMETLDAANRGKLNAMVGSLETTV